jgi:hypothetical protein
MKRKLLGAAILMIAALALALTACGDSGGGGGSNTNLASITINGVDVPDFAAGKTSYTVDLGNDVTEANVTGWPADATAVPSYSRPKQITNLIPGESVTIIITVTSGGQKKDYQVTVTRQAVPIAGITLNPTTVELLPGGTAQLAATVLPANATNKGINWASGNITAVAVDTDGNVTVADDAPAGNVTITATAKDGSGKTATCTVTVVAPDPGQSAAGVSISFDTLEDEIIDITRNTNRHLSKSKYHYLEVAVPDDPDIDNYYWYLDGTLQNSYTNKPIHINAYNVWYLGTHSLLLKIEKNGSVLPYSKEIKFMVIQ